MTATTFNRFRLGLALAAALSSVTALAAGGSPSVSFNGGAAWGVNAVGVGESAGSSPDPMLVNTSSSPAVIPIEDRSVVAGEDLGSHLLGHDVGNLRR